MKKKHILVMLTNRFPYTPGEEFIETEIEYLSKEFDNILVIPVNCLNGNQNTPRKLPDNAETVLLKEQPQKISSHFLRLMRLFKLLFDFNSMRWLLRDLTNAKKFGFKGIMVLLNWVSIANEIKNYLKKMIVDGQNDEFRTVFYSYWLTPSALALAMLKEKYNISAVSRVHGGDLYADRHNPPYLPLQMKVIETLDQVFTISKNGCDYLTEKNKNITDKLTISRLGTKKVHKLSYRSSDNILRIVSCSYLKPVKRIGLLAEALKLCSIPIEWTHIGDGELRQEIEQTIKQLPKNIKVNLMGNLSNKEVINTYLTKPVDLFINVSESEGIPVTIMEAFSCGIPVMATNVGGTSELVNESNGELLDKDITPEKLAKKITEFAFSTTEEKIRKSKEAYRTWEELYNAEKNYLNFARTIKELGS
jgi:glycosyltransferase involved in cell wall biosynthesis